ncbi:hypothetical protein, partial [Streptomyces sp. NPDC047869]|uniref:hypothetical protein n=1 Tax=Streptomyces sp. NPDC047869 TaxID=3154709 RepID=UPI0034529433
AENGQQFVVDDLEDLLGGVQRLGDLGAERALLLRRRDAPSLRDGELHRRSATFCNAAPQRYKLARWQVPAPAGQLHN